MTTENGDPRDCIRGHGPMIRQEGHWELSQIARVIRDESGRKVPGALHSTGTIFTVAIYACPTCRYVELVDEDL